MLTFQHQVQKSKTSHFQKQTPLSPWQDISMSKWKKSIIQKFFKVTKSWCFFLLFHFKKFELSHFFSVLCRLLWHFGTKKIEKMNFLIFHISFEILNKKWPSYGLNIFNTFVWHNFTTFFSYPYRKIIQNRNALIYTNIRRHLRHLVWLKALQVE